MNWAYYFSIDFGELNTWAYEIVTLPIAVNFEDVIKIRHLRKIYLSIHFLYHYRFSFFFFLFNLQL